FAINNRSGGVDGLAEAGDPIVITYSENISVPSLCSNGSFASLPDSATATVTTQAVVKLTDGGAAADTVSVTANDCTLHLGTIGLGTATGASYISGGAGATFSFSASSIGWNGSTNVLTITLGATTSSTGGGTLVTDLVATTATYTPTSSLTDTAGNAATGTRNSANTRQF
ncbi:MAG TPA: hypothetical protein VNN79_24295, partial [Actinomycetota bacterium]|nr:hypothetical protein [Actinomycetota bacterium]